MASSPSTCAPRHSKLLNFLSFIYLERQDGNGILQCLNDSLAFILYKSRTFEQPSIHHEHYIDIWMMMEYAIKESGVKKYSIHPFSSSKLFAHGLLGVTIFFYSEVIMDTSFLAPSRINTAIRSANMTCAGIDV
ncbi:hypothetical protein ACH5RR_037946 [Cinchona calisaya]|uniref:Uncharacterized protein n=1 Tax=Cinchona calisaya TaxID=153742 RepID=A0ABD2YAN5_9GENT